MPLSTAAARLGRHTEKITVGLTASSLCLYFAYRTHDRRVLTNEEISAAQDHVERIATPSTTDVNSSRHQHHHMQNLNNLGVTVIKDTLTQSQVIEWRDKTKAAFDNTDGTNRNIVWNSGRAHCSISKRSIYYDGMSKIGCESDITEDSDVSNQCTTFNRWLGRLLSKKKGDETVGQTPSTNNVHQSRITLQQVVRSYFAEHNIPRYELTDVQFLNAYPNKSTNQIWHRDNKFKGLTAIIALKDVRANGPTELIPGSHRPEYTLRSMYWMALKDFMPPFMRSIIVDESPSVQYKENQTIQIKPLLACIDAGDAVLYDARIFHRGRANNITSDTDKSDDENDRPVLVLRWDASRTPPPGAGLIVTTANVYWGRVLYAGLFLLEKLYSSSDSSD